MTKKNKQTSKPRTRTMTPEEAGLVNNPSQRIPRLRTDQLPITGTRLKAELISDQQVTLDKTLAARYIDLPIFPGERQITDGHVQFLYDEMRKGSFLPHLVNLATAVLNQVEYKINGQHTCWAVIYMPDGFSMPVRELKFRVDSPEQLKLLYSAFDRLKARTDAHVMKVQMVGTPVLEGLGVKHLNVVVGGFKTWCFPLEADRRRLSPAQVNTLIQSDFPDLFRTVAQFVQDHCANHRHMLRHPVVGAMFATFEKVVTKAPEFWLPVATGIDIPSKNDPRLRLRDLLMQAALTSKAQGRDYMGYEAMYRACLYCWNRWRRGEDVKLLRAPSERPRVL